MQPRASYRVLAPVDAWINRIYTARFNPLYHSGATTAALLVVLVVTGIYLLLFYRIGAPYASVRAIHEQLWLGRWIRGLHRFASDAAVVMAYANKVMIVPGYGLAVAQAQHACHELEKLLQEKAVRS